MQKRILITGASGLLGWNIAEVARDAGWQVHALRRRARACHAAESWQWHELDLTRDKGEAFGRLLDVVAPTAVVHCAAAADAHQVERSPHAARRINVDAAAGVARQCGQRGIRCLHVSSDLVFDGSAAPYDELSPPRPLSEYGRQKAGAEAAVAEQAVICRVSLLLGCAAGRSQGALAWLLDCLRNGRPARLFVDEFRSPLTAAWAARGLLLAAEQGEGVWHLAGDRVSRLELGRQVAAAWQLDDGVLQGVRQQDVALPAPRPRDVTLRCSRARAAGFAPPSLAAQLAPLAAAERAQTG